MIAKTFFRLTDGLILCANKLCGIDPIDIDGESTDFLSYLFFSSEVSFAFKVSAILATILVILFTVFMILRSIAKDKVEGTPTQIAVKSFKTTLMFFLVPAVMVAFMWVGNTFLTALYNATLQASSSPGSFLFAAFAEDGGMSPENVERFRTGLYDYNDTDLVWECMDLTNFPFIFAWITGGVVLFSIGSSMLIFVDRVLSLVILYIVSPISISSSVIDDGARFKLWRDQFLSKFIMGYGMLLAVNVYALVCALVMKPGFSFVPEGGSGFVDLLLKLLVIAGGALTMQKSMAIIGNLVSAGAGSNELRDNALSASKLASMAGGLAGGIARNTIGLPFRAGKSILGDALAMKSRDWGAQLLDAVGLGLSGGTSDKDGVKDPEGKSKSKNDKKAEYGKSSSKDAIKNGDGFKLSFDADKDKDNSNNNNPKKDGNDTVSQAINNGGSSKKEEPRGNEGEKK